MQMKKKKMIKWIVLAAALLILFVELFPIIMIIMNGFKTDRAILRNPFDFVPTFDSYRNVFRFPDFLIGLRNSLVVGLIATAISVFVGAMASYGISRFQFRGRKTMAYSFLISRMIPQISLAIPLFIMFNRLNMSNNIVTLILAYISFNVPYIIWLLIPFFSAVSRSYEEAALVDGCNRKQIFWRIFLPLTAPGIVVAAVFAFIVCWNEFIYALLLVQGMNTNTAPIAILGYRGQYAPLWGQLNAASTMVLIPVFIFTLTLQKYIIRGLTAGGVKG